MVRYRGRRGRAVTILAVRKVRRNNDSSTSIAPATTDEIHRGRGHRQRTKTSGHCRVRRRTNRSRRPTTTARPTGPSSCSTTATPRSDRSRSRVRIVPITRKSDRRTIARTDRWAATNLLTRLMVRDPVRDIYLPDSPEMTSLREIDRIVCPFNRTYW